MNVSIVNLLNFNNIFLNFTGCQLLEDDQLLQAPVEIIKNDQPAFKRADLPVQETKQTHANVVQQRPHRRENGVG